MAETFMDNTSMNTSIGEILGKMAKLHCADPVEM